MSVVIEVKLKNNPNGAVPDGTGGILRVTQDGQIVDNPPLGRIQYHYILCLWPTKNFWNGL